MSSKGKEKEINENRVEKTKKYFVSDDYIVKANMEGVIQEMGSGSNYDEIEYLGSNYDAPEDEGESDVSEPRWNMHDGDERDADNDSEVGEVDVDDESDDENDGFGQLCVLPELESSSTHPYLVVGMTFEYKMELKRAIDKYAITHGFKLKVVRSDKNTFRVLCEEGCSFTLYASTFGLCVGWQVKSITNVHMCARVYDNPRASTKWLANYFKDKVQEDPKFKTKDMKAQVQRDLKVRVSVHKCKRAKKLIMEEMEGSFKDEFRNLEAYCNELRVSNPGSDVCVDVSREALEYGQRIFKRMYVCFNASKVGWKEGCRPLIGVDGTFLKGKSKGILLTAVGFDGNDGLYPLALGLVDRENALQWSWFLQWLSHSLDIGNGETVTFMSDMQKGLAIAVGDFLPAAEHRFCARHIYANWSNKWRGNEFKKKFFLCAWSTYIEELNDNLTKLGSLRKEAAEDAVTYNVKFWVRAYFTSRCRSWVVDNNMSESFNAWIDEYRFLPIIRMFEGIRLKMMAKWAQSETHVRGWKTEFSPKCMDLFESNRYLAVNCRVFFNGDDRYEIVKGQDRHIVVVSRGMCTCRAWDLTGIPCQHVICVMYHAKIDPKSHISHYYHKDTYIVAYRTKLQPVRGSKFWDTKNFPPMQPPHVTNLPGRPQKKRTKTEEAVRRRKNSKSAHQERDAAASHVNQEGGQQKLSKHGKTHKCSQCKKPGHNKARCKEVCY